MKRWLNKCAKCKADLSDFNYCDSLTHIQKCDGGQLTLERFSE